MLMIVRKLPLAVEQKCQMISKNILAKLKKDKASLLSFM